jgi:hypothetical protein
MSRPDDDLCDDCGRCKSRVDGKCWYCVERPAAKTDMIDVFEGSA